MDEIKRAIRSIPDWPKPGIVFRDITPVLADPRLLALVVERVAEPYKDAGVQMVAGTEARGFILAPAVALRLGAGFVPIRKAGKLPWKTFKTTYELEYGTDTLEMHRDAIAPGTRVLMVDDLLATGQAGGEVVACAFMVELSFLGGRQRLAPRPVYSLVDFASETE